MRNVCLSVAMSLDGYIAGPNGEHDWIPMDPDIDFAALFTRFDTVSSIASTRRRGRSLSSTRPDRAVDLQAGRVPYHPWQQRSRETKEGGDPERQGRRSDPRSNAGPPAVSRKPQAGPRRGTTAPRARTGTAPRTGTARTSASCSR